MIIVIANGPLVFLSSGFKLRNSIILRKLGEAHTNQAVMEAKYLFALDKLHEKNVAEGLTDENGNKMIGVTEAEYSALNSDIEILENKIQELEVISNTCFTAREIENRTLRESNKQLCDEVSMLKECIASYQASTENTIKALNEASPWHLTNVRQEEMYKGSQAQLAVAQKHADFLNVKCIDIQIEKLKLLEDTEKTQSQCERALKEVQKLEVSLKKQDIDMLRLEMGCTLAQSRLEAQEKEYQKKVKKLEADKSALLMRVLGVENCSLGALQQKTVERAQKSLKLAKVANKKLAEEIAFLNARLALRQVFEPFRHLIVEEEDRIEKEQQRQYEARQPVHVPPHDPVYATSLIDSVGKRHSVGDWIAFDFNKDLRAVEERKSSKTLEHRIPV
jgi:hypothetical protein